MINEILRENNFSYVVSILDKDGTKEQLHPGKANLDDVIKGISELNKCGIVLTRIQTGQSREGVTKITNIEDFGLYKNNTLLKPPVGDEIDEYIPFKTDSWILGEYIVKQKTGKHIPRRFLKSQKLLDTFIGDDEVLKKLLVLDPTKREYSWEIFPIEEKSTCIII